MPSNFSQPKSVLDVKGFLCPIPALRTRKALVGLLRGDVLVVEASDPKTKKDIPLLCEEQGHRYLECQEHGEIILHIIEKG